MLDLDRDGQAGHCRRRCDPAHAQLFYRANYWLPARCDRVDSVCPPLAIALFDGAVHHGPGRSVRQLQQALGVMVDGVLGSQTLRVLAAKTGRDGGRALLLTLLEIRAGFMLGIVRKDPSQWANAHGWSNRLLRLQSYLLSTRFGEGRHEQTQPHQQAPPGVAGSSCWLFRHPRTQEPPLPRLLQDGRRAHLKAYLAEPASMDLETILYSHHATRQSLYEQGLAVGGELDRLQARARHTSTQQKGKPIMPDSLLPQAKPALRSRAVIGGVIAVGAGIAGLFGVAVDAGTQTSLVSTAVDLASAIGGLLAIWGRLKATHVIK